MVEDTDNCIECNALIQDGEGRLNYPSGTRCMKCGNKIDIILKTAERLIEYYNEKTGYNGVRIKWI